MDIFQHTTDWIKGELFEGKLVLIFGIITCICAFLFYKVGTTPNAKALLFPLLIAGFMFVGIGGSMLYSNPKRLAEFPKVYQENPDAFVEAEKERVETFTKWYPTTRYVFAALGVLGVVLFLFWNKPIGKAIGIALLLMTIATYVVDHFSEERAATYYQLLKSYTPNN
ncbi:hypothetical protein [Tenacibaculum crassostreae]|uniref:hypothetical protein n=1 Tax=Tenacibaculum crassostreae TaxID=502683 RepID=UPI003894BA38